MSRQQTSFILGYHGCEASLGEAVLAGSDELRLSTKRYDWLGQGVYFWEGDHGRALDWAKERGYKSPFVVGAVIDPGECLDLLSQINLDLLQFSWRDLEEKATAAGKTIPENKNDRADPNGNRRLRYRDCAVIEHLHRLIADQPPEGYPEVGCFIDPFDTVRAPFIEGAEIYPGSGFHARTHTQIAVRNLACIKGYFRPRP